MFKRMTFSKERKSRKNKQTKRAAAFYETNTNHLPKKIMHTIFYNVCTFKKMLCVFGMEKLTLMCRAPQMEIYIYIFGWLG